jgi:NO-binding membrane sensor protein with MHYT domain
MVSHFFETFFIQGGSPVGAEKGSYQLFLVLVSYFVASLASYTALCMAQQIVAAKDTAEKRFFLWGGAFAMGAGIWAMHFTGMLSYKMRMAVSYNIPLTVVSVIIAIIVSYAVLSIVSRENLPLRRLLGSAVLLGFGICGMHYTGMAAMTMDGSLRYIPGVFFLSVAIAIVASAAALWVAFTLANYNNKRRNLFQIGAALIMGAAICGMHYTGMAATVFIPYANCRFDPNQNFDFLAMVIASVTSIILSIALIWGTQEPGSGV